MKSWLRLGITASLISTTLFGSVMSQNLPAIALPMEQIVTKLEPIPVFTVADETGAPLVATGENNTQVAGVFISQADAQEFVQRLQQENPDLGSQVRVVPVSLSKIYELAVDSQNDPTALQFAYVPVEAQVQKAEELMSASGEEFPGGVPLFVATTGEDQGYLTIQQNNEQVIPFFFEKQQLDNMITNFKQEQPELADQVAVEVVPLEVMLSTLQNSNDEGLDKIVLIPTTEAIEFIRSTTPTDGQP
ncbi:MAG: hypothetical protein EA365_13560 [Gloeocapsa sp. DLM2.Bin57]|nr:MAG: hypothetical protein EA365_13560 [Gloeocapsa sp. DLM2.Bin57]